MALDIATVDWETFYSQTFSLSKMTTEAYVRDPQFEEILCSFQLNDEKPYWVPQPDIGYALRDLQLEKRAVLMHHAHFDAFILYHVHGIRPKLIFDTLGMARALHGANGGLRLAELAERYGLRAKGHEVQNVKGMRFKDFTAEGLRRYGNYGLGDIEITRELGKIMIPQFSKRELLIHDQVIRMFTEPCLRLDSALLDQYRQRLSAEKMVLLLRAGVQQGDLMSNDKFAQCLMDLGVEPPRKISPTTGKETWAFAKTDPGMQALQEHDDSAVQVLVEARLKNKTTIAERGAETLIGMASRGSAAIYLKYSGASGTHRLSGGGGGFNWQAMKRGSDLRNALTAEDGELVVVADSSTIEARLLDWLAGQEDMVEVYRKQDAKTGPDMYCTIAEKIYGRPIDKFKDPDERQMGKTCIAEGELVLTSDGLVPIEKITIAHRIWDGVEWVNHEGVICNGEREVIEYRGLRATPDHEVYCIDGRKIPISQAASEMARIVQSGYGRQALRIPGNHFTGTTARCGVHQGFSKVSQLWQDCLAEFECARSWGNAVTPSKRQDTYSSCESAWPSVRCRLSTLQQSVAQTVCELWRAWYSDAVRVTYGIRTVDTGEPTDGDLRWAGDRPREQRWTLRAWQPSDSRKKRAITQPTKYGMGHVEGLKNTSIRLGFPLRAECYGSIRQIGVDWRANNRESPRSSIAQAQELARNCIKARVYDIVNAGPRHRFTVSNMLVANCKLGLGFGLGDEKFVLTVRSQAKEIVRDENNVPILGPDGEPLKKPMIITREFSKFVVDVYRNGHPQVKKLWRRGEDALKMIAAGEIGKAIDYRGIIKTCKDGLILPNGMRILYPDLRRVKCDEGKFEFEWEFWNGRNRERIYGAKVVENFIQALARIIVFDQCYDALVQAPPEAAARWAHSVHDEGVFKIKAFYAPWFLEVLINEFRRPPSWAPDLPLNGEGGFNKRYGQCKK